MLTSDTPVPDGVVALPIRVLPWSKVILIPLVVGGRGPIEVEAEDGCRIPLGYGDQIWIGSSRGQNNARSMMLTPRNSQDPRNTESHVFSREELGKIPVIPTASIVEATAKRKVVVLEEDDRSFERLTEYAYHADVLRAKEAATALGLILQNPDTALFVVGSISQGAVADQEIGRAIEEARAKCPRITVMGVEGASQARHDMLSTYGCSFFVAREKAPGFIRDLLS